MLIGDQIEKDFIHHYSYSKSTSKLHTNNNVRILSTKYFDKKQYKNSRAIQELLSSDDNLSANTNIKINSKTKKYFNK